MNEFNSFKDVNDEFNNKFENSDLGKQAKNLDINDNYDIPITKEVRPAIKNKIDGLQREQDVREELEKQYSSEKGYSIISEAYLRDKDGKIVKDSVSGEARRIDFIVVKDDIKLKRDDSGITTMGIFDFLLNENSLEMSRYVQ